MGAQMDNDNILEFSSTVLFRHYRDIFKRVLSDNIVCIVSGDVKFFVLSKDYLNELLSKSGKKIILDDEPKLIDR